MDSGVEDVVADKSKAHQTINKRRVTIAVTRFFFNLAPVSAYTLAGNTILPCCMTE